MTCEGNYGLFRIIDFVSAFVTTRMPLCLSLKWTLEREKKMTTGKCVYCDCSRVVRIGISSKSLTFFYVSSIFYERNEQREASYCFNLNYWNNDTGNREVFIAQRIDSAEFTQNIMYQKYLQSIMSHIGWSRFVRFFLYIFVKWCVSSRRGRGGG